MADYTLAEQGGTPVALPGPSQITRPLDKISVAHTTLDGSLVLSTIGRRRQWTLTYTNINDADYEMLEAWVRGDHGVGPFEFSDRGADPILVHAISLTGATITWFGQVSATLTLEQAVAT